MTTIIEGMTPAAFVAALNANFLALNNASGVAVSITTITVSNYIAAINSNNTALGAIIPTDVHTVAVGEAKTFITDLNSDITNLNTALLNELVQDNTLYVSNSGSDVTGNGSLATPYATLAKVSTELAHSTKVLIAKGSTFINDKLDLSDKNNIFVDSYGDGIAPILTGLKAVTGWTDETGNIWSKQDDNFPAEITNVFIGGVKSVLARTELKTATGGGNTTLTDSTLTEADDFWVNAELVVNYYTWLFGISRVTAYASKAFTIPTFYTDNETPDGITPVKVNDTYFIQNHRGCLTAQDTWAYNSVTKTLYIYSTTEPASVTATYGEDCIYSSETNRLTIQNLTINGSQRCAIRIDKGSYLDINHNTTNYSGYNSILVQYVSTLSIKDNTLTDQNSDAVSVLYCKTVTIQDNPINKCGYVVGTERYMSGILYPGMNGNGVKLLFSEDINVLYNEIHNIGFNPVSILFSTNFLIQYNYTYTFHLNHSDGGGVYVHSEQEDWLAAWMTARGMNPVLAGGKILNNICIGSRGTLSTSEGIYLDLNTFGIEVAYNFITGCYWHLYSHLCLNNNWHDNTVFAINGEKDFEFIGDETSIDNIINNNLFVNKSIDVCSITISEDTVTAKTITNNKYYYPFGKGATTMFSASGTAGYLTLAEWKADEFRVAWGRTSESEITPSLYAGSAKPEEDFLIYLTNPAKTVRVVTSAELPYTDYVDMDGVVQTYPFNIPAYGSKVLVRPN